jgi:translocation and assembly module TamA
MASGFSRILYLALCLVALPHVGAAQEVLPDPALTTGPPGATDPRAPIISDDEFERDVPSLDAPSLESIDDWNAAEQAKEQAEQAQKEQAAPALRDGQLVETLSDAPVTDPLLDEPLPPIDIFDAEPPPSPTEDAERSNEAVRYVYRIEGLAETIETRWSFRSIRRRFNALSALEDDNGRADSRAELGAGARADRQLLLDILSSEGFFDAAVEVSADRAAAAGQPITIILSVVPGRRYFLGTVTLDAPPVMPTDLITSNFIPSTGDPIVADAIVGSEANISVKLPQNGYPFAKVGQRDILLDPELGTGDYTLPVVTGPRSYFGNILTLGNTAFDAEHIAILRRFEKGELYDSRLVDDLRAALTATGLLSTVAVEPLASGETAPDGTPYADLLVRQEAGPPRTLAASAGYGTGQGFRAEGSWTHRNLFPPEGALTAAAVIGTLEQSLGASYSRANAGRRDRNFEASLTALHSNYEAFDTYTGRLGASISYVSTPIWQKKFTYSTGVELLATYETRFDLERGERDRQLFYVAALPSQVGFDTSDDLLDPTRGFRVNLRLSPETALGDGSRVYLRGMIEGSYYQPLGDNIVLAARARVGSIVGTTRRSLPPSRRYYGGGGGSVRGFGYQQLGPRDPENNPIGGRSVNETAAEIRYRFGNFGVAGFVDAGQIYESSTPQFDRWRIGAGIGGRFYTNFGPMRLDLATPINRRPGEAKITVYVSLGQAF